MNIKTSFDYPPIPIRQFDWSAWDDDSYDGAPDSSTRNEIGYGTTEAEAVEDLKRLLQEKWEYEHPDEGE